MSDTEGAAAPTSEQPQQGVAAVEQATPTDGIRDVVDATPENAEQPKLDTENPEGQKPEGEEERKRLSKSQRQQRKIARLSTMVAEQATELDGFRKSSQANQDAEPKEADFNGDYFAWQRAVSKWDAKQLIKEVVPQTEKKQPDARAINHEEAVQEFLENVSATKPLIPDFDATVSAFEKGGGKLADHVIEEIRDSEKGPMLLYHLAKNPAIAAELNAMSPRDAAREIGRLEAKTVLPERKTTTKTPAPLTPLRGGAAPTVDVHALAKSDDATAYIEERRKRA